MERVLAAWNDHCADPYLPRTLAQQLARAGLRVQRREVISLFNPVFDPNTYSYGVIGIIETFVPGHHGVTPAEAAAWAADLRSAGETGDYFFSLNRYLFLAVKPEAG
jgi:hypothetical protein